MDAREKVLRDRIGGLNRQEKRRLRQAIELGLVCYDTYNFDVVTGTYCPLACAKNLHKTVPNPTDEIIRAELAKEYQPVNALKGVPGKFYTEDRKRDLLSLLY